MKLGARILKTGIAIVLSLYIAQLLHSPSPVFAAIAAIFAIQPTIYRSYLTIIEQIQGNVIGAVLAVIFVLILGNHFIVIGLAAIIVIILHLKLKLENNIGLSLVTLISIMETTSMSFIQFAGIRFSTIMIGVFSAFIVNLVFMPPKYENKLYLKIVHTTEEMIKWIRLSIRHNYDHHLLKEDIKKLKENVHSMEQLYKLYKEERKLFKKNDLEKARKLVVYRQMTITARKALDTLKRIHRYENELLGFQEKFKLSTQEQLDSIVYHHEQLMLRFIGKIPTPAPYPEENVLFNREELFHYFLSYQKELAGDEEHEPLVYHTMQIIASIIDYGEQVEHLDKLITSFHSYHHNKISIEDNNNE
ncbi:aromatic acid exporter family protein [Neobacillus mesonae]|uniref:FUSC family protein n=1 Tax=Neobacillus mesonae TaxID=1193713 RepID=UPI002042672C|nr:aromatic acid exporter family protein [Neobacillus mesonae]MCM3569426.1 aromatic acid exporter family protein [Neobacillus mesonae]